MFPDPVAIGSAEWSEIGKLLQNLWLYLVLIATFGIVILTAHAVIPSLISTRQVPQSANLLRFSLTVAGLGILVIAIILLIFTIEVARVIEIFYDRYWI